MKTSIVKALQKEYSYAEYRKLIVDLLQEDKVTGIEQSEDLLNYSALNETRMHRLDKTIAIIDENIVLLQSIKNNQDIHTDKLDNNSKKMIDAETIFDLTINQNNNKYYIIKL